MYWIKLLFFKEMQKDTNLGNSEIYSHPSLELKNE